MSHDDLKKIAKLRNIKNQDILAKEDLIYTLLRSEKIFMKIIMKNILVIIQPMS